MRARLDGFPRYLRFQHAVRPSEPSAHRRAPAQGPLLPVALPGLLRDERVAAESSTDPGLPAAPGHHRHQPEVVRLLLFQPLGAERGQVPQQCSRRRVTRPAGAGTPAGQRDEQFVADRHGNAARELRRRVRTRGELPPLPAAADLPDLHGDERSRGRRSPDGGITAQAAPRREMRCRGAVGSGEACGPASWTRAPESELRRHGAGRRLSAVCAAAHRRALPQHPGGLRGPARGFFGTIVAMKCVILAGGFGTRISEESVLKPKPMIEIGGKPIIWHIMKIYSAQGVDEFIVCLGYKGYVIKEYFANYFLHMSHVTIDMRDNSMQV